MKSIRSKLFTTYSVLIVLIVVVLGAGFSWVVRALYLDTLQHRMIQEAQFIGKLLVPMIIEKSPEQHLIDIDKTIAELGRDSETRLSLIGPDGTVWGDSAQKRELMDNHFNRPEIRRAAESGIGTAIRYSESIRQDMLYVAVSLESNGDMIGYMRLAQSLASLNKVMSRIQYALLLGLFSVLGLALAVTFKLSAELTSPLEKMSEVAERISGGELTSRIYLHNKDELGDLANSINHMAESLEEQVKEITAGRDQLEAILSTMVEGVVVFDHDGKAVMVNPMAKRILGLEDKEWFGLSDLKIIRNTQLHDKMNSVRREKVILEHEIQTVFPENKVLSVNLVPVVQKEGEVGVLAVFHDITRLRKLEKMRADFAANVSHEMRTPLTAIRGFAETLLDGAYSEPESALRFAEIIHKEAERLNKLIEDVLKLSVIESNKTSISLSPVIMDELVLDVVDRLSQRLSEYKFSVDIEKGTPPVSGDYGLLLQAIYNLLDNAIKYTQASGRIILSVRKEGDNVQVIVEDNGIGIPKNSLDRIFERFYRVDTARTRRFGGAGLGLAIVKHIVEAHNGKLRLESEEGKGTKIIIELPVN